jgi:prepilin-type processing-associated H-X9-DG protein
MKQTGLTLVELLVAVAVVTLFMATLLPCLQNSRSQAKAVLCTSNVKQLVIGLLVYEAENANFPYALDSTPKEPPVGGYAGNLAYDRAGWWWFDYISDYSRPGYSSKGEGRKPVLWCPSRKIRNYKLEAHVLHGNYGVNQSICKSSSGRENRVEFVGKPIRATDVLHSSQTLLIVDSGYAMINWWHVTSKPPEPLGNTIEDTAYIPGLRINEKKNLWPGQEWDAIGGRHPKKSVNVGFADGHSGRTETNELFVEKIGNDSYKNLSPLWLPK